MVETGGVIKTALFSDFLYGHTRSGFKQLAGSLHFDSQDKRCRSFPAQSQHLAMELTGTHAKIPRQRIHIELAPVHEQIDLIHNLGQEASPVVGK